MQREILSQRSKLGDADSKARGIKTELHECIQHVQDPKALKDAVKKMYQRHAADDTIASKKLEEEIAAEYSRQREYLEKSVESLKRKVRPPARPLSFFLPHALPFYHRSSLSPRPSLRSSTRTWSSTGRTTCG